jgi:hypothetical protein
MADDLLHPDDRPDPAARFRTDLAGYLRHLSGPELADLLDGLPDPVKVDLIAALAACGPAHARLPATWPAHPDAEFMRRRSLREVVTDRRAARAARPGLAGLVAARRRAVTLLGLAWSPGPRGRGFRFSAHGCVVVSNGSSHLGCSA